MICNLSPVSISTLIKGVFPISLESVENISQNSVHKSLEAFHWASVTSASCNSTFLCISMSAGEVINPFSIFSLSTSPSCSWSTSLSSSSYIIGEGSVEVSVFISDKSND